MPDIASMRARVRDGLVKAGLAQAGTWYDISNQAEADTAVVRIYDEISWWGVSADDFARDLAGVSASEIEVQINSPGGSVFDGITIFNALRSHPARITTRVDGVAASIASVIAQAGDHRVMLGGAQMMIHQAWGVAVGTSTDMRDFADLLDRQNANCAAIYATRSGEKSKDEFLEILAQGDTWLSDEEAVEMGLADEVVNPEPKGKPEAKARPAGPEGQVLQLTPELLEQMRRIVDQTEQALAAMQADTETSPAGEREEETAEQEPGVNRDEADRLIAALTFEKEI